MSAAHDILLFLVDDPETEKDILFTGDPAEGAPPALAPDHAFPTMAALAAMLAASHEAPAGTGPDLRERAEILAMMGIDPVFAADAGVFREAIAAWVPPAPDLPFDEATPPAPLCADWLLDW